MTNVCSTVVFTVIDGYKIVSNQRPSACSVNNSDEMGRPGRWFSHQEKFLTVGRTTRSVKGA